MNNDSQGVTIEIQGPPQQIDHFLDGLIDAVPPLAQVDLLEVTDQQAIAETGFTILNSLTLANESTSVSPEVSICEACLAELLNPDDRRFQYPFINCTNCGPRFTIVEDIPYDRASTTMKSFVMCPACQAEYDDPANRRFHAQPNACHECGPAVWWVDGRSAALDESKFELRPGSIQVAESGTDSVVRRSRQAIQEFHDAMEQGWIVAVKGVGGFHLACDATNQEAVSELRKRKGRVDKPLALMVRDIEQARQFAQISQQEQQLLESRARPIVLLARKMPADSGHAVPCPAVAPGNHFIGVMLPYSPLHHLLVQQVPLVMTSGNLSEEPIARSNGDAQLRLADLADGFLLHDRDIQVVCDDSVVRCVDGQLLPLRRSRGYAPMPVQFGRSGPEVFAIGGEIKSTFCVTKQDYAYMSQHVGDMGNLETLHAMQRCVEHFLRLFRVRPEAIIADLHPGYLSGQWAEEFAKTAGVALLRVQHHFAHVASLLAEKRLPPERQIIGCCFDGTGYGTDGAIWGGEFMIANGTSFDRVAQLKYTPLPGGDASIRRPYRIALAQLWSAGLDWKEGLACVDACPAAETRLLRQQLEKNVNCVSSSSMGRLFDAVASLMGIRQTVNYEAQAAMEMEALAASVINETNRTGYAFKIVPTWLWEVDSSDLLKQICADAESGIPKAVIAARFHHAVATMIVEVCNLLRQRSGLDQVGLTGGVFQNALLLQLATAGLEAAGFEVLTHSVVPPNDGGIALGQALVGRNQVSVDF